MVSQVVATFETTYDEFKDLLDSRERRFRIISDALCFELLTWETELCVSNVEQLYKPLRQREFVAFIHAFIDELKEEAQPITPMMMWLSDAIDPEDCQIEHGESQNMQDTVRRIFHAVDEADSMQIDFRGFRTSTALSRCVAVISIDPLLASKAMVANYEVKQRDMSHHVVGYHCQCLLHSLLFLT